MTDSKERFSIPPASTEQIAEEVKLVGNLIPPPNIPVEDRHAKNTQLRVLLTQLSNEALWELRGHQLSRGELVGRLQRFEPFAVESLGHILADGQDMPNSLPKGVKRIYGLALQNMVQILPEAKSDEAVEALSHVFPRWGRPNGAVIEYLLRLRPDRLSISDKLADRMKDEPVLNRIRQRLTEETDPRIVEYVSYFLSLR